MKTQNHFGMLIAVGSLMASSFANASPLTTNLLSNPGAETGTIAGWTVGGVSDPSTDTGTFDPGINPHSGSYDFYGHTGLFGSLSQTVQLVGNQGITAAQVNAGILSADVSFWEQGLNQGDSSDSGQITLSFLGSGNALLGTSSTAILDNHLLAWGHDSEIFAIPVGTKSIEYTMNFIRRVGSDNDSFIDDNVLTISGPVTSSATPEPAGLSLAGLGLGLGAFLLRRRARS